MHRLYPTMKLPSNIGAADTRTSELLHWAKQPQRIIPGLKTNTNLSPTYSFYMSLKHKSLFCQTTTLCRIFLKETYTTHHTSYLIKHIRPSRKVKNISTVLKRQPRKAETHVLEPIYFARALARKPASIICSREQGDILFLILRAHTRTGVSNSQHRKNSGGVLEKKCRWMAQMG